MKALTCPFAAAVLLTSGAVPSLEAGGGALLFNPASSQYVEVPDFQNLNVAGEVTVEFWAKVNTDAIQQSAFMLSPDDPTHRFQAHLNYFNGNTYWDCGDIGAGGRAQMANAVGSVGTWTHYALVTSQAGGFMKIYVNGVEKVSKGAPVPGFTPGGSTYTLRIGGSTSFFLNGSLDEFRLWKVARTAGQIQAAMGSDLTGSEAGLEIYFKFDEIHGAIVRNSAVDRAAWDGRLVNGPTAVPGAFTVTTTADENDTPSGPSVSLREALRDAAAVAGPTTIGFASSLGGQTVALAGEIAVNDADGVTLDGSAVPGGVTVGKMAGNFRLFTVAAGRSFTLRGLTLAGGGGAGFVQDGGAVFNNGSLTLGHCTLSGNRAGNGEGGAIFNNVGATATLTNCTLSGNQSSLSGGAIRSRGTLSLTHCTITANAAGSGIFAGGGGVYSGGPCTLTNCIVAGNGTANGADFFNDGSISAAPLTRVGANIVVKFLNVTGSVSGPEADTADPLLGPLADNGGPTKTHALLQGSAAFDAAVGGSTAPTDQRGLLRSVALPGLSYALMVPDLGALEVQSDFGSGPPEVVVVTSPYDENDPLDVPGEGLSLREALRSAPPNGIVRFHVEASEFLLEREISVGKSVTVTSDEGCYILNPGDSSRAGRFFSVETGATLRLRGLTFTNGGGYGANAGGNGGAIANFGTVIAEACTFRRNVAPGGGGAILNVGSLELLRCTMAENSAGAGGAIYTPATLSAFPATSVLTHCTVSGNQARGTDPAGHGGGGVHSLGAFASVILRNTIVAGNAAASGTGPDLWRRDGAPLTASGSLLGNAATTGLVHGVGGNLTGVDPRLSPLGPDIIESVGEFDYFVLTSFGGPSPTMALGPGSPARNAALALSPAITEDQRGSAIVGAPDIGAYEAGAPENFESFIWENLPVSATAAEHSGGADYDGDGASNDGEYAARTDPARADSVLRPRIARSGGNLVVSIPTVSGRVYSLLQSDGLTAGSWSVVGAASLSGDGSVQSFTVPVPPSDVRKRFYAVRVQ